MARVILVASGKGGVGKSTVTAFVAQALAAHGKRVLVAELDAGFRCLDVALGLGESVVMDLGDVLRGNASVREAAKQCPFSPNLQVICSPVSYEKGDLLSIGNLMEDADDYDFILMDCPAGIGRAMKAASKIATEALVIATPDPSSVRAAKVTGQNLRDLGVENRRLVIERCPVRPKLLSPFKNLDEIIDQSSLQLIGIVWEDAETRLAIDSGRPLSKNNPNRVMFDDIAARIGGCRVDLGVK